jgi:hypothetical protein
MRECNKLPKFDKYFPKLQLWELEKKRDLQSTNYLYSRKILQYVCFGYKRGNSSQETGWNWADHVIEKE